jgi:serine/threonine-protein phosphatase 4 regulatory subunit 1
VLQRDPRKWRIRQSIASQLGQLAHIYSSDVVFQYIVPIAFKLCSDPVSDVRSQACKNIGSLVEILKVEPSQLFVVVESIKGFAYSGKYNQRQSFIDMISNIVKYNDVWEAEIIPCLEKLTEDKVVVVRIVLANFIGKLGNQIN